VALYLQMVGRALRPAPGKERAIILDHAGNALRHGLYDFPHDWTLKGREPKHELLRRFQCGAVVPIAARACPECGHVFARVAAGEAPPRVPEVINNQLVHVQDDTALRQRLQGMSYRNAVRWAGKNEQRLYQVAAARGYRKGWVYYQVRGAPR